MNTIFAVKVLLNTRRPESVQLTMDERSTTLVANPPHS
jgi:hypothetical protein